MRHGGIVDRQDGEGLQIEDPHGMGIFLEEISVAFCAFAGAPFGNPHPVQGAADQKMQQNCREKDKKPPFKGLQKGELFRVQGKSK